MTPEQLARILNAPGAEVVRGLSIRPVGDDGADDDTLRALAGATATAGLERLHLYMQASTAGFRALQWVKFDRLAHIAVEINIMPSATTPPAVARRIAPDIKNPFA